MPWRYYQGVEVPPGTPAGGTFVKGGRTFKAFPTPDGAARPTFFGGAADPPDRTKAAKAIGCLALRGHEPRFDAATGWVAKCGNDPSRGVTIETVITKTAPTIGRGLARTVAIDVLYATPFAALAPALQAIADSALAAVDAGTGGRISASLASLPTGAPVTVHGQANLGATGGAAQSVSGAQGGVLGRAPGSLAQKSAIAFGAPKQTNAVLAAVAKAGAATGLNADVGQKAFQALAVASQETAKDRQRLALDLQKAGQTHLAKIGYGLTTAVEGGALGIGGAPAAALTAVSAAGALGKLADAYTANAARPAPQPQPVTPPVPALTPDVAEKAAVSPAPCVPAFTLVYLRCLVAALWRWLMSIVNQVSHTGN